MTRGACSSGDALSARAGCAMLEAGGNAMDAAIAAKLVASVTLPTMTGLGGGGVLTARMDGEVFVGDHFARMPGLARGEVASEPEVVIVPFEGVRLPFLVGEATIAVPGMVAGIMDAHARFGRLPFADVVAPAIEVARGGMTITEGQAKAFALLEPIYRRTPESWALVGPEEHVAKPGDRMKNEDLARTLEALRDEGADVFYRGELARRFVEISNGWVTREDLAAYEPVYGKPLRGTYRDWQAAIPGAPSLTGAQLLKAFEVLDARGLPGAFDSVPYFEALVDAMRAGAAIRTFDYEERIFEEGFLEALVSRNPGGSTMQCSAVDSEGNAVSWTSSVGEGCGLVLPGSGVVLNNFLGEEDIVPEHMPRIAGRRMLTSMCPILLQSGSGRVVALGAAGSARIRSAILQVAVHVVDGGQRLQAAVDHPRVHAEGDTIYIEAYGRTPEAVQALEPLGSEAIMTYELGFFFGGVQAARLEGDSFSAAADTARRGCAGFVV